MKDSALTIFKAASRFFSGTLLSRLSGFFREVTMAFAFGTTPEVAAFWMAYRFAFLLRRIFGEGAMNIAFIPHFESLKKENPAFAARFFSRLLRDLTLFFTIFIVLSMGVLSFFNHETARLTMLLLPALLFITLYALQTAFLQCEGIFFLPTVAPVIVNVCWILAALFFSYLPLIKALERLAVVITIAYALQWLLTLPPTLKYLAQFRGKEKFKKETNLFRLLKPFTFAVIGVTAAQINSGLDALFARGCDPQGPAILWYAIRLEQLPLSLFGIAITSALLPPMTRAFERGDKGQAIHFFRFAIQKMVSLLTPITCAMLCLGLSFTSVVYGRGAFGDEAIIGTTKALWGYVLGLVPMSLVLIYASTFYAQKETKKPTLISLFSIGFNVLLNAVFVYLFKMGIVSIALATSLSAMVNLALLANLRREFFFFTDFVAFLRVLGASTSASIVTMACGAGFLHDKTLALLAGEIGVSFPESFSSKLFQFSALATIFGVSLLSFALLFRAKEIFRVFTIRKMIE